jgi:two-component system sensor histidine kinase ChvG
MRQRHDARLRVVDAAGALLADSARIAPADPSAAGSRTGLPDAAAEDTSVRAAQETFLYRLASFPVRLWRKYLRPPQPPSESDEFYGGARILNGQEIKDALAGEYGAVTRVTAGQQSLTLYSAIPIPSQGRVAGAVLVSQSTFRMLSDLYALRLDIFRLFLWSVATAVVLSLLVSATITVPISRLRDQAHAILDPRGRLLGGIVASRARDEVGELSRSLGELTARLQRRVGQMESFASDVSHEFKNPLASIRSAAEIANASADPEERRAMLTMVVEDVKRMERLLTGVREISRIDSGSVDEEGSAAVDVKEIAARVVSAARRRSNGGSVTFTVEGEGATARLPPGRLEQVVENLVDNAASFSPEGGAVRVSVGKAGGFVILRVQDQGPGVPPEHRQRIFDRFFSFRPHEKKGAHAGLGLSIVKAIAESHGGTVAVESPAAGGAGGAAQCGAAFEVRFPEG